MPTTVPEGPTRVPQKMQNAAGATADVNDALASFDVDLIEMCFRVRGEIHDLLPKPRFLRLTATEQIAVGFRHSFKAHNAF